ncbi:PDR/VanB family oxidoreductase [Burkholderia sp. JKS000303]|uniref:PDR/VanB family oxidoreductase n=1 Tax=Burkholderia sp. JKS000303 TaxID=1938747 RepID=UPI000BF9CAC8|nr:PDR/VanB family oxidoreductase [Burkholderia sp. JKS000303]PFH19008.1 vanillate O-demethylase ferredoxin subunit [Burkholderia sp. JKS000303]
MNSTGLTVKVVRKTIEAIDICSLELVDPEGAPLPAFTAGSHIDVHTPDGHVRQYSLCNAPNERGRYLIAVLRTPTSRGGSIAVHDDINEGDTIRISAPRNHFPLAAEPRDTLLLAAGIGITPILCMAEQLSGSGVAFTLHYCTRTIGHTAFRERILASSYAARTVFHHSREASGDAFDIPSVLSGVEPGTHLYVCGPVGFLEATLAAARSLGWSDDRLHYEYFGASTAAGSANKAFQVKVMSSGQVHDIPVDRSVTSVLAEAGVDIPVSCEQGVCGTCLTRIVEGEPEHRDLFLTEEEHRLNDQFTPCCSRSKSPLLVLDI